MEEVKKNNDQYTYVLRQSTVMLITRLLICEIVVMILHYGIRFAIAQYFDFFSMKPSILVMTTEIILIQLLNLYILLAVILTWIGEQYILNPKEVIIKNGVLNTKLVTYEIANLQSMTISQNILQKIFNFGSIRLFNPVLKEEIYISNVPEPHKYGSIIQQYQPELTPLIKKQK